MRSDWGELQYYNHPFFPSRLKTKEVKIGKIPLGGTQPIRIQSMVNTSTADTSKSVEQAIEIFDAGASYVRFTASSSKEAENLQIIRQELNKRGYQKPIVADVHFNPKAAEIAAQYVEKVRINPGNFLDKKKFEQIEFAIEQYQEELNKLDIAFSHFLDICKQNKTAVRIGTNHGSLSDRIMSRYGDTPKGMVEATMEFLRIAVKENFNDVVISLKSSNTRVMVYTYRLMVHQMQKENMMFPLHLGVTEAGEGEDGRIKSAVGIGTLLLDGIGDTIRVSLTESPALEIPVAQKLLEATKLNEVQPVNEEYEFISDSFDYNRRETNKFGFVGGSNDPVVIIDLRNREFNSSQLGLLLKNNKLQKTSTTPDFVICNELLSDYSKSLNFIIPESYWKSAYDTLENVFPLVNNLNMVSNKKMSFLVVNSSRKINALKDNKLENCCFIYQTNNQHKVGEVRQFISKLNHNKIKNPVLVNLQYSENDYEKLSLKAASEVGSLLVDGFIDGLFLEDSFAEIDNLRNLSFNILQASRSRIVKTEYISCPSCGRTQFNIEKVTAEIRKRTNHLVGLKIGIMGCIVNGPGEMADADYGYVGTAQGKITIYKSKEVIKKNIPSQNAVDELITVIKDYGDWKEPEL